MITSYSIYNLYIQQFILNLILKLNNIILIIRPFKLGTKCRGTNCRGTKCRGTNCRGTKCRGTNCRGTNCRYPGADSADLGGSGPVQIF